MRARPILVAALIAALASRAVPAGAVTRPDIVVAAGATAAVESTPGGSGASLGLSLLWPLEEHFRFGVMGFADDLGVERDELVAPGGANLGPVPGRHRAVLGGVWRVEAHLPSSGRYDAFMAATWGVYRVSDDVRGEPAGRFHAPGFGLGLGLARRVALAHAAGITLRYQQLSRGTTQRYLSAAAEWRWQGSAAE